MGSMYSTVVVEPAIFVSTIVSDMTCTMHHVEDGGCLTEFTAAMLRCHPDYMEPPGDDEACVKATAALRRCFAGNPEWFRHKYIPRMDVGLDEDLKPSPEQVKEENRESFRWWTGMRRSY